MQSVEIHKQNARVFRILLKQLRGRGFSAGTWVCLSSLVQIAIRLCCCYPTSLGAICLHCVRTLTLHPPVILSAHDMRRVYRDVSRVAVPPSSGLSPVGLPLMLSPTPAPPQPCQFATVFLLSVDHLGHTVKVSKCAPWASRQHTFFVTKLASTVLIVLVLHLYAHSALSLFSASISSSTILLFVR